MALTIVTILCAYLLGSVPTGLLLAKAFGDVDIRTTGSGNIGATNVYRTLGRDVVLFAMALYAARGKKHPSS